MSVGGFGQLEDEEDEEPPELEEEEEDGGDEEDDEELEDDDDEEEDEDDDEEDRPEDDEDDDEVAAIIRLQNSSVSVTVNANVVCVGSCAVTILPTVTWMLFPAAPGLAAFTSMAGLGGAAGVA